MYHGLILVTTWIESESESIHIWLQNDKTEHDLEKKYIFDRMLSWFRPVGCGSKQYLELLLCNEMQL